MIIFGTFDYCEFVLDSIRPSGRCSKRLNTKKNQNGLAHGLFLANDKLIGEAMFKPSHRESVFEAQYLN